MGSLSADKAGVGSAVNDTTRELGGTLGVAIIGSVFASIFGAHLADNPALAPLPTDTRDTLTRSMAAAQHVIGQLPTSQAGTVRSAVDHAFLDGLQIGSLVSAAIALTAALAVALVLPPRTRTSTPTAAHPTTGQPVPANA
jgi:hypothetical protein